MCQTEGSELACAPNPPAELSARGREREPGQLRQLLTHTEMGKEKTAERMGNGLNSMEDGDLWKRHTVGVAAIEEMLVHLLECSRLWELVRNTWAADARARPAR